MKQSVSEAKRSVNWSGFPHAPDHILCQVCRIELVQHLTSFSFLMAVTLFLVTKTLWTAIYRQPRTSKPAPGHRVYPYLLGGMDISRTKQVWAADITYIPMAKGSCTWWPLWTCTVGMWWPGSSPTPWMLTPALANEGWNPTPGPRP